MSNSVTMAGPSDGGQGKWAERFLTNVAWSWLGVAASFFAGFFLSPYIIRTLGEQRYGIWALAFAFIDYFNFFDFGFKSAIVNFISRYRAQGASAKINEVINTAFFYFIGVAAMLFAGTWLIAGHLQHFFRISEQYQTEFTSLVRIIGAGWAAAIALSVFVAGLEAYQLFKIQNHINVLSLLLRSGGSALCLYFGYGLTAMGIIIMMAQFLGFGLTFWFFRGSFTELRISPALARRAVWAELAQYGVHAFIAQLGTILQNQGPPVLIGHYLTEAFVGFYTLPNRLLQYMVELVTRIASVTAPNTAELMAQGRHDRIAQLGMYLNRYCFALFAPFGVFLLFFGKDLTVLWVGPVFGAKAAPLLPSFILMTSFAVAGQFNSAGILFGLARHQAYARALILESVLTLVGFVLVLPRFGILGAAWVACLFAILNRGLLTPYLLCQYLDLSWWKYMRSIYALATLLALPTSALAYTLRAFGFAGNAWVELLGILSLLAIQYYCVFFFLGIEKDHRNLIWDLVSNRVRAWRALTPSS